MSETIWEIQLNTTAHIDASVCLAFDSHCVLDLKMLGPFESGFEHGHGWPFSP